MNSSKLQGLAMNPTTKYQLVELLIGAALAAAGSRFYFQDQPQLRSQVGQMIYLQSIATYSVHAMPVSLLSTNVVAPTADILNGGLVLNVGGREDLQLIPLVELQNIESAQAGFTPFKRAPFTLDNLYQVDWTKSYVQLAAAGTQTAFSYMFGVRYVNNVNVPPGQY